MRTCILILGAAAMCYGQAVEFIGLEESTRKAVEEKLERLPDGRIHYCAADLKKAGFADASVNIYVGEDKKLYTVVAVVEGKRSGEVRYRQAPTGDVRTPAEWTYEAAVDVLAHAREAKDRVAAAKELKRFGDRDGAWLALAAGLRDSDERVSGASTESLRGLRKESARRVDWGPAAEDVAAVLRGTNLFGFLELARTLTATGVDPSMAKGMIGQGGGRLLLAFLETKHEEEHTAAHALLVQLRGKDLGNRAEDWREWLGTL